jgi:hypothetical protein
MTQPARIVLIDHDIEFTQRGELAALFGCEAQSTESARSVADELLDVCEAPAGMGLGSLIPK